MMPNVTKGAKPVGLMAYLFGPGRNNEHTNQHAIAGSPSMMLFAPEGVADPEQAKMLGRELDRARRAHDVDTTVFRHNKARESLRSGSVATATAAVDTATVEHNVWHCSLSLHPDEAPLSDEKWAAISHRFMELMDYHSPAGEQPETRWLAVRHGLSGAADAPTRNDHIHIAASTVRADGSRLDTHRDYPRAQSAAMTIEREFGLRITTGRAERHTTKGTAPAQEQRRARVGRAEPVRDELARTVRATAGAAESEAEFVRLARAHGLLIRPRYANGSREVVTGYSVALPTDRYATKNGAPVWHGGGKLGNDLTLPRLRETWIAGAAADADAMSAWAHNHRERIDPSQPAPTPRRAQIPQSMTFEQARDRLRDTLTKIASTARTEAAFVGDVFSHPDLLIRPRFAQGSTTEVTGYSVALRPHIYARVDGAPQWHGAGKLDNALTLTSLREQWAPTEPLFIRQEWARAAGRSEPRIDTWRYAAGDAQRWRERIEKSPPSNTTTWSVVGGDTAATVSAWALRTERGRPAELSRLADALAATAGQQRSPAQAARRAGSAARRAAAMILAASQDDPTQAYMVMFAQIAATARAIADAAEARGNATRAVEIRAALDAAQARYAQPSTAHRGTAATVTAQPARGRRDRGTGYGR